MFQNNLFVCLFVLFVNDLIWYGSCGPAQDKPLVAGTARAPMGLSARLWVTANCTAIFVDFFDQPTHQLYQDSISNSGRGMIFVDFWSTTTSPGSMIRIRPGLRVASHSDSASALSSLRSRTHKTWKILIFFFLDENYNLDTSSICSSP